MRRREMSVGRGTATWMHAGEGVLVALLDGLGVAPESEVAVYSTGGVRSGHVFFVLQLLGYPKVRNYDGSMWEWAADRSLPVE